MSSFTPALRSQTTDVTSAERGGLTKDVIARRIMHRRQTLLIQLGSYVCTAMILSIDAFSGLISLAVPLAYLTSGSIITAFFLATSQSGFNDRFKDHYLTLWQMSAHIAVQIVFLLVAPQVGYIFLCVIFLTFSFATLRMTFRQSAATWTVLMLLALPVLVLLRGITIAVPTATFIDRLTGLLTFGSVIGQCAFIGLYGNHLRQVLYQRSAALEAAYERIAELAEIDELTGSFNRRSIMRTLDAEILRATRLDHPCSVALIDLDWFKRINDMYGHPTGDEVLRTFAITAFANIREIDFFGRYGGEEFLLVLPETPTQEAEHILNRVRLVFADLDWSGLAPDISISVSAGVATLLPNETSDALLARADAALYKAKRNGRNRIACAA